MDKISHKKLVNLYKKMGYVDYDIFPGLNHTVLVRAGDDFATIIKGKRYEGKLYPEGVAE